MKITHLLAIGLLLIGLSGCSKDDDSDSPSSQVENTPSAVASTNNSSAGVYKGVLVGSSGYFKISIKNGTDTVYCELNFDGKTATLSSTYFADWTPGDPIDNAVFSGTWNGQSVSLTFSCDADGTNRDLSVSIPGHTVAVSMYKETSTNLVKCYEGTYIVAKQSGNITGVFNFIVYNNTMIGFHFDSESSGPITGTISGNTLTMDQQSTLTVTDTSISGHFLDGDSNTITVTGKRSL